MKTFSLRITAELKNIPVLHRFIESRARDLAIGVEDVYDLRLALEEVITNTINYGHSGREGTIRIDLARENDTAVIQLWDDGEVFDPTTSPPPDFSKPPSERLVGGIGLYLLRESVDEIRHEARAGGGNHLTLKKTLTRPPAARDPGASSEP